MKKFKSALSLLTAIIMVFAMMPGAMANEIAAITAEDIARYASGNSDGRLIEAGMTVSYGDGETMTAAPYLVDGFHYSPAEVAIVNSTTIKEAYFEETEENKRATYTNTIDLTTSTGEDTLTLFDYSGTGDGGNYDVTKEGIQTATTGHISLSETNNIIEIGWSEEKTVKRLEMWIHPVGAVKTYKIQYYNGTDWIDHTDGDFDQTQTAATDSIESKSAVSYIITFDEIRTSKLRFVATDFKENVENAIITEIVPRSHNNVNLLENWTLANAGDTKGWFNGVGTDYEVYLQNSGQNRLLSPYVRGYSATRTANAYRSNSNTFYPNYARNRHGSITLSEQNGTISYATRFPDSPKEINLVAFTITKGAVREFEVLYGNDLASIGSTASYSLATTVKGEFTTVNKPVAYIPENINAEYWMIKLTDYDAGTEINKPEMYVLGDSMSTFGDVSFAEGYDEKILVDNNLFRIHDSYQATASSSFVVKDNLDKLAVFNAVDSGIEYKWDTPVTSKRLDLWVIASPGGIGTYDIEALKDDGSWEKIVKNGNLDYKDNTTIYTTDNGRTASYHPIIFDKPITTKHLRFVIKSFAEGEPTVAYISEAKLRTTNEINLLEFPYSNSYSDYRKAYSPYLSDFDTSIARSHYKTGEYTYTGTYNGNIWPYSGATKQSISPFAVPSGKVAVSTVKDGKFFYATRVLNSKVKINKLSLNVSSGTVKKFEVWVAPKNDINKILSGTNNPGYASTELTTVTDAWIKVADIDCEVTSTTAIEGRTFEIPKAILGDGIYIEVTDYDAGTALSGIDMYSLADYELESVVAPTDEKIEGIVAAGEKLTFSVFSCNYDAPDAKVFFALYEDNALTSVSAVPCALSGVKTQTAEYTIPATADGALKVVAYLWDGKTLEPLVDTPVTAESTPAE